MRRTLLLLCSLYLCSCSSPPDEDNVMMAADDMSQGPALDMNVSPDLDAPEDMSMTSDMAADMVADLSTPDLAVDQGPQVEPRSLAETVDAVCPRVRVRSNPPNSLAAGDDMHKLTIDSPGAVCNDGSPAVAFIKRATSAQDRDRWVFHVQGGGGCRSYQDCVDRWCGDQSPVYEKSKMSSRFVPETIAGKGILNTDEAQNPFARANHVFVYYCSSDSWQGRSQRTVFTSEDGSEAMAMPMAGHTILEELFASLKQGGTSSDDGEMVMPDLDEATLVLWTGVSAGSTGAQHNVDWVADQLPDANVRGVFDAGLFLDPELISEPAVAQMQAQSVQDVWAGSFAAMNGFVDESCLAAEPEARQYMCLNTTYVRQNYMTTPFFQRADLRDPNSSKGYVRAGGTLESYGLDSLATLTTFRDVSTSAAQADQIDYTPGIYAMACAQHVAITSNAWFFAATVQDASGTPFSFAEALQAWLRGEGNEWLDNVEGSRSDCEATTDDAS